MAKQRETKKKEDLKSFTVGSVQPPSKSPKSKAAKGERVDISEKDFPIVAKLLRIEDKDFQVEAQRVLGTVEDFVKNGDPQQKAEAQKVERAYVLALALLENGKAIP